MATRSNLPQREETAAELLDRLTRDPRWSRLWQRLLTPVSPATQDQSISERTPGNQFPEREPG